MKRIIQVSGSLIFLTIAVLIANRVFSTPLNKPVVKSETKNLHLNLLFDIPLRKGSVLSDTSEENAEYPDDIQYANNKLYILSGNERKIITYDLLSKKLSELSKVNNRISTKSEKEEPQFIRLAGNFIIVGFGSKVYVFNRSGELQKKISADESYRFLSSCKSNLLIWNSKNIQMVSLDQGFKVTNLTTPLKFTYFDTYIVSNGCDIFSEKKACLTNVSSGNARIRVESIPDINYSQYPQLHPENTSLICVTPTYYIFYAWVDGRRLFLVNRQNKFQQSALLDLDIGNGALTWVTDKSEGLRVACDGDNSLYMMVMKRDEAGKRILVYQLNLKE